ncbi:hypothetical protein LOAG_18587 [Loa loa]|uniref:Uncharacterized protein n=1 Tax=Loa loa TaxID=7209 RepID=A0A1S0UGU8_LOALO|nr:hypothetical protein LOAG_18587 [Loa loa]EJD74044.1 hypothetical protein LOAG_18587 [Loa loa]
MARRTTIITTATTTTTTATTITTTITRIREGSWKTQRNCIDSPENRKCLSECYQQQYLRSMSHSNRILNNLNIP